MDFFTVGLELGLFFTVVLRFEFLQLNWNLDCFFTVGLEFGLFFTVGLEFGLFFTVGL